MRGTNPPKTLPGIGRGLFLSSRTLRSSSLAPISRLHSASYGGSNYMKDYGQIALGVALFGGTASFIFWLISSRRLPILDMESIPKEQARFLMRCFLGLAVLALCVVLASFVIG